jgi:hypothetical protein
MEDCVTAVASVSLEKIIKAGKIGASNVRIETSVHNGKSAIAA